MKKPVNFSVLMATYKGEQPEFLDACLSSLADQSLPPSEIVLVKDGALSPNLERVLSKYRQSLPLLTVDYKGEGKLGGALALGVTKCSNEIIARMDSDDIALPERFEKQLTFYANANCDVLGGAILEFSEDPATADRYRRVPLAPTSWQIQTRNPLNHMTVIYRKSDVLKAGNYLPLDGFEDWYLWLRMHSGGAKIANMADVLVKARTNQSFASRRSGKQYRIFETTAFLRFRADNLIGLRAYVLSRCVRGLVRLCPANVTMLAYRLFLRR